MAYAFTTDLINEGNLGKEIDENKLIPHIESAEIEIRKLIGDTLYDKLQDYQNSDVDSELRTYKIIVKAESILALSYAVHSLNIETQGNGLVGTKGWDQSRSELLSRNEINDLSSHFRTIAMDLLEPYLLQSEIPDDNDYTNDFDSGEMYLGAL